jgi:hypothetical protein
MAFAMSNMCAITKIGRGEIHDPSGLFFRAYGVHGPPLGSFGGQGATHCNEETGGAKAPPVVTVIQHPEPIGGAHTGTGVVMLVH